MNKGGMTCIFWISEYSFRNITIILFKILSVSIVAIMTRIFTLNYFTCLIIRL